MWKYDWWRQQGLKNSTITTFEAPFVSKTHKQRRELVSAEKRNTNVVSQAA